VERPQRVSTRTNDVEARQARRILRWPGGPCGSQRWAKERLAVAAAEQEGEPLQVVAQLSEAVGGVADEVFQRWAEAAGVTGQPLAEELQHFGEFGGFGAVEPYFGHGFTAFRNGWRRP